MCYTRLNVCTMYAHDTLIQVYSTVHYSTLYYTNYDGSSCYTCYVTTHTAHNLSTSVPGQES